MSETKFYKCQKCGKVIVEAFEKPCPTVCCGEEMVELNANTEDAAQEKHVPVISRDGNKVDVVVGSVEHPMTEDHYITFIALEQGNKLQIAYLTPDDSPKASFLAEEGPITVYEYCNLHGLWKAEA